MVHIGIFKCSWHCLVKPRTYQGNNTILLKDAILFAEMGVRDMTIQFESNISELLTSSIDINVGVLNPVLIGW